MIFLLFGILRLLASGLRGAKVAQVSGMRETDDLSIAYLGWAVKRSGQL